ncbi:hypothetical protein BpHYR1_024285 [Brachionus plicatilis]|uniref:Uncharacterized protein n=1 Tax=Brachionus plicatilis TaxID=10195 RepID=A0A3M7REG2_BRAPC|nr:hypothetical protein BpHYR1_024285 [Brachionus plicatilis]
MSRRICFFGFNSKCDFFLNNKKYICDKNAFNKGLDMIQKMVLLKTIDQNNGTTHA